MYGSYYSILGVSGAASEELIRARYLALIRRYHPDHNASPLAHARAAEITEAFRVLTDRRARTLHDRELAQRRIAALRLPRLADQNTARGRAMMRRRRPRVARSTVAPMLVLLLIVLTAVVAWKLPRHLAPLISEEQVSTAAPAGWADTGDDAGGSRRLVAETRTRLDADVNAMPAVDSGRARAAARLFARVDAEGGLSAAQMFSKHCHDRAETDGRWDTADFCAAFDQAAYISPAMASGISLGGVGYFIDMHDRQTGFYAPRLLSTAAVDARLERLRDFVAPEDGEHMKIRTIRVLRSLKRSGWALAGAAGGLLTPDQDGGRGNGAFDF